MIRLHISSRAAESAACAAVAASTFCGLTVDSTALHNGAWISAIIGILPALLIASSYQKLRTVNGKTGRAAAALLNLILLGFNGIGTAEILTDITRSAGYMALDRVPEAALLIPAGLALAWCLSRNGNAVGYSAGVWLRVFPALLLLVAVLQIPYYHPAWLRPVLGSGWQGVLKGSLLPAGRTAALSCIFLFVDEGENDGGSPFRAVLLGTGIAALMILLRLMMTPTPRPGTENTWLLRLDSLLANGRAPLYLQLPMIVIWYAGLLHLLCCSGFNAAALLQRFAPKLDGRICVGIVVVAIAALSASGILNQASIAGILDWRIVPLAAPAVLAVFRIVKGGDQACDRVS